MTARYFLLGFLVLATPGPPADVAGSGDSATAESPASGVLPASSGPSALALAHPSVPDDALRAYRQGRYWHASRMLREHLASAADSTPRTLLLAARAEAGWGGWEHVETLLAGRDWLDTIAGGYGWRLLGRGRAERGRYADAREAFERYLRVAENGRDRGVGEFRLGRVLREMDEDSAAIAALDRAAEALTGAADWIAVRAADAAAALGDTAAVDRRVAALDADLADRFGWRYRVEARRRAGDLQGALRVAVTAEQNAAGGVRAETAYRVGGLRLETGDTAGARAAFARAIDAGPATIAAIDAARRLSELPDPTPDEHLLIGRTYLRHGNADRAAAGIGAYLDAGRGSPAERARLRLDLGRSLFNGGNYRRAERVLLALADDEAVDDVIAAEALLRAGRAQYRQGRETAGRETLVRTADRFPHSRAAVEAMFLAADLDHDADRIERARSFYRRAVEARPDAYEAGLARMRLAGIALLHGDDAEALSIFEDYRRAYPDGRRYGQATYWAAKSHFALGDTATALRRLRALRSSDPFSYYGIRAADLLGESFWNVTLAPSPESTPAAEAEIADALDRVDLLRELGLERGADDEVDRLVRRFRADRGAAYALAEALNARGLTTTGIQLGWTLYEREGQWNRRLLHIIHPFPYEDAIRAEARERELDPYLVAGLIRRESMFLAGARSPAGAIGLMQIMPYTGRALARGARIDSFRAGLLEQPDLNLHLGTGYLAELLDRFDARKPAVLAAYNAGPHRVRDWATLPEFDDGELFTERIPYRETRHYVKVVQEHARLYAALYDSTGVSGAGPADDDR